MGGRSWVKNLEVETAVTVRFDVTVSFKAFGHSASGAEMIKFCAALVCTGP